MAHRRRGNMFFTTGSILMEGSFYTNVFPVPVLASQTTSQTDENPQTAARVEPPVRGRQALRGVQEGRIVLLRLHRCSALAPPSRDHVD